MLRVLKSKGSESMDEVAARVTPALLSLRDEYPGKRILVVVHAGVMISQGLDHRVINEVSVGYTNGELRLTPVQ
jgi:broad specificity phosphatase PhoE